MEQNETKFKWNVQRHRAALLVADDKLTDEEISDQLKIGRVTLHRWKTHPDFQAEVERIVAETREKLIARGILEKQNRLDALNDRHKRMQAVIDARAVAYASEVTGGETGLLVKQIKGIGKGDDFEKVEEYAVDTSLLREMREHEKQVAQELGDWTERSTNLNVDISNCSDDELERIANGEDPARILAASRRGRA